MKNNDIIELSSDLLQVNATRYVRHVSHILAIGAIGEKIKDNTTFVVNRELQDVNL